MVDEKRHIPLWAHAAWFLLCATGLVICAVEGLLSPFVALYRWARR